MNVLGIAGCLVAAGTLAAAQVRVIEWPGKSRFEMSNATVRLVVSRSRGSYSESYFALGRTWHPMLRSGNVLRPDPALVCDRAMVPVTFTSVTVTRESRERSELRLRGSSGVHSISKTVTLEWGRPYFHVTVRDSVAGRTSVSSFLSTYSFIPGQGDDHGSPPCDFVWTPSLRPDSTDVIGDHAFRSPALMMQKGHRFASLIPDVRLIDPLHNPQTGADVRTDGPSYPMISYGILPWKVRAHVYYAHTDDLTFPVDSGVLSYGYDLYLNAGAPARQGYRDVVRFLWSHIGHANFVSPTGPQSDPFSVYLHKAWDEYLPMIALDTVYGGARVTLLRQQRLAWSNGLPPSANNDCWFTVWFNSLRTAFGGHLYACKQDKGSLKSRTEGVFRLALAAPDREGVTPSIFYEDSAGGHWVADQGWGGIDRGRDYSVFNNEWTDYWLLRWADLLPARREEILNRTGAFADFLVRHQKSSGVVPSWYDPVTLTAVPTFRDSNAETAGAAFFLAEEYLRSHRNEHLTAASRAMNYIISHVLPENAWSDFETYFSCSQKPLDFYDAHTSQRPQNTLSMQMAAEACRSLYRATGNKLYVKTGARILDYLCLYQQVWSPPWLHRQLFGGFGVQNTDGEWSDSRQGYFAVTLMHYFVLTGRREYLERAVAALRAMFSLFESPASPRTFENYAHSATDYPGGVTGINWGTGSSATSIALLTSKFGDAYVDIAGRWGVGIDGCRIPRVTTHIDTLRVTVVDAVSSSRTIRLTAGQCRRHAYEVIANGRPIGRFSREQLGKGIPVPI